MSLLTELDLLSSDPCVIHQALSAYLSHPSSHYCAFAWTRSMVTSDLSSSAYIMMNDSNAYCFFFLCTLITEKKQCSLTFTRPASTLQSMNHSLLHTSFFLSGLTTLGVPEPFAGGEDRLISLKNHRISMYVTQRNQGNMVIIIVPSKLLSRLPVLLNSWSK